MWEGVGKKIVAKVHEKLETSKALESMDYSQEEMSRQREEWITELRESGVQFDGEVEMKSEKVPKIGGLGSTHKYTYRGMFDGRMVEIQFTDAGGHPLDSGVIDCKAKVDGVDVDENEAQLLVRKYRFPVVTKRYLDRMSEVNKPWDASTRKEYGQ